MENEGPLITCSVQEMVFTAGWPGSRYCSRAGGHVVAPGAQRRAGGPGSSGNHPEGGRVGLTGRSERPVEAACFHPGWEELGRSDPL